jgi:hypothetical protein
MPSRNVATVHISRLLDSLKGLVRLVRGHCPQTPASSQPMKIAFQRPFFPRYVQLAPPLLCYAIRIDDKPLTK